MPSYRYEVKTSAGQVQTGVLSAANMAAASELLRAQKSYILSLAPADAHMAKSSFGNSLNFSLSPGPGLKEVSTFTTQLAVMIKAGISIRSAIDGIADQTDNPKFKIILMQIKKDVESGRSFSDALLKHPKVFSPLYVNMVKASELSGSFGHMLDRIVEYLNSQMETKQMVVGAAVYPAIIGIMAVSTTFFLLLFVVPQFSLIFKGHENILPAPTKFLLFLSFGLKTYWYLVLAAMLGALWGFWSIIRTPQGKLWWDKTKLTLPLLKKMFRALYITRSLHTMGELVNAGVPMLDTLAITADISGNQLYRQMWRTVYASVKQGKKINYSLQRSPHLPRSVVQMIAAGEESGKLGETLDSISKYYNKELKATIKTVTSMMEPLMIIFMGGIVGFIAMSIILPIFKMSQMAK
ncbi:MAG: type II secretion system F family protein [Phycisphaerales bacterium]|nr:type II secretion system F family protein [Phycisphaerales bacterium]